MGGNLAEFAPQLCHRAETIVLAFQPLLRRIKRQINRKRTSSLECVCVPPTHNPGKCETVLDEDGICSPRPSDNDMFSFVFTKSKCSRKAVPDYETQLLYEYHTKPLRKVWRRRSMRKLGWSPKNTLILEDTPQNCVSNYGNALYIRTFDVTDIGRSDSALLILQAFLDRLRHVEDVRTIEKRDWERLCASTVKQTPHPFKHAVSAPSVSEAIRQQRATAITPRSGGAAAPAGHTSGSNSDGGMYAAILTPRSRNAYKYNPVTHHHNGFYTAEQSESDDDDDSSDFDCENDSSSNDDLSESSHDSELASPSSSQSERDTDEDVQLITPRLRSASLDLPLGPTAQDKPILPFEGFKLRARLPNRGKSSIDEDFEL